MRPKLEAAERLIETLKASTTNNVMKDIADLKFEKELLEKKLRKFAAHCKLLEEDKANIVAALRTCRNIDCNPRSDVTSAVITLCDRLTSLEKEISSLSDDRARHSTMPSEVENLRQEKSSLQAQISELQSNLEKLQRSHAELLTKANLYEKLSDEGSLEATEKVRRLEKENLQLMRDLKVWKSQYKTVKAELESQRLQAFDDATEVIMPRLPVEASKEPKSWHSMPIADDKENVLESPPLKIPEPTSSKKGLVGFLTNSSRKKPTNAALGEVDCDPNEENTTECKQS